MMDISAAGQSFALDSNSGHPGYHQSGKIFDVFLMEFAGTLFLGTGPAWTSDTARGTGAGTTELEQKNGVWTNKNSLTTRIDTTVNTYVTAANTATYLGSFRATANGQATDSKIYRGLWNLFNQINRMSRVRGNGTPYAYSTASYRVANNDAANGIGILQGMAGGLVTGKVLDYAFNSTTTPRAVLVGIGLTTTGSNVETLYTIGYAESTRDTPVIAEYADYPGLGFNTFYWLNLGAGADTQTWQFSTRSGLLMVSPQ